MLAFSGPSKCSRGLETRLDLENGRQTADGRNRGDPASLGDEERQVVENVLMSLLDQVFPEDLHTIESSIIYLHNAENALGNILRTLLTAQSHKIICPSCADA